MFYASSDLFIFKHSLKMLLGDNMAVNGWEKLFKMQIS